jgi:hypothetical protein
MAIVTTDTKVSIDTIVSLFRTMASGVMALVNASALQQR